MLAWCRCLVLLMTLLCLVIQERCGSCADAEVPCSFRFVIRFVLWLWLRHYIGLCWFVGTVGVNRVLVLHSALHCLPWDLEMGLERASQRKKPQRNVVLTIEQKAGAVWKALWGVKPFMIWEYLRWFKNFRSAKETIGINRPQEPIRIDQLFRRSFKNGSNWPSMALRFTAAQNVTMCLWCSWGQLGSI